MSAIDKYEQFMAQVDWNELSAGEKEALYEATYGAPNPDGTPFRVITDGGKASDVTIIYKNSDPNPTINLTHEELVEFHRWLEDAYMDGNAELFNTMEREKEKTTSVQNHLDRLYVDLQNIATNAAPDIQVTITPVGSNQPVVCFIVDVNKEFSIFVFTKEISQMAFYLLLSAYRNNPFKYYIQQNSNNEYQVISKTDFVNLQDATLSEINNHEAKKYTYGQLLDLLHLECLSLNEKIKRVFHSVAQANERDNKAISLFLNGINNKIGIKKEYKYTNTSTKFSFAQEDEDKFYRLFFKKGSHVKQICRYCGLESLFQILSNQTIRLNGLVGMNDKSEYKFAWDSFVRTTDSEEEMEEQMDRVYIMSCSPSTNKDNLEMWRLYGDDGKGVCLIFDVVEQYQPFILAQIIYEYTRDGKKKINDNKWSLLRQLTEGLKEIGLPLKFSNQNKWLSLMKSGDYCYEQEIRLLYAESEGDHQSKNWVLTKTNSILNPYVQFDLLPNEGTENSNVIPLTLKGIILGPKCPEKETNVKQLNNMIKRDPKLSKLNIEVKESEITNYR